jgi:Raf kinase inhibitor-like YbhB/YbcL family protein
LQNAQNNFLEGVGMEEILVKSNSFLEGKEIPTKYTCQGEDISPHLKWNTVDDAKTYALIFDDPDAPMGTWVHWRIFNIPAKKTELQEGETTGEEVINSFGGTAYGGPCPPSGRHRYYFKIYALDAELKNVTPENFDSLIAEHAIAKGQIMGTYEKK